MVNVREARPAGIVTVAGTETKDDNVDWSETVAPPLVAGKFRVRVPVGL